MKPKTGNVDEYLATVPPEQRAALTRLRKIIRDTAPNAEECISYHIPSYKLNGMLVGFGSAARHCSLYVMGTATMRALAEELKRYDTSKGTVRFKPEKPLPVALVRKIVKARMKENERRKKVKSVK